MDLEILSGWNGEEDADTYMYGNRGEGFQEIDSLSLVKSLDDEFGFASDDFAKLICLVSKNPLCGDYPVSPWAWNEPPGTIPHDGLIFGPHCIIPLPTM
jgi:hypothetical protein